MLTIIMTMTTLTNTIARDCRYCQCVLQCRVEKTSLWCLWRVTRVTLAMPRENPDSLISKTDLRALLACTFATAWSCTRSIDSWLIFMYAWFNCRLWDHENCVCIIYAGRHGYVLGSATRALHQHTGATRALAIPQSVVFFVWIKLEPKCATRACVPTYPCNSCAQICQHVFCQHGFRDSEYSSVCWMPASRTTHIIISHETCNILMHIVIVLVIGNVIMSYVWWWVAQQMFDNCLRFIVFEVYVFADGTFQGIVADGTFQGIVGLLVSLIWYVVGWQFISVAFDAWDSDAARGGRMRTSRDSSSDRSRSRQSGQSDFSAQSFVAPPPPRTSVWSSGRTSGRGRPWGPEQPEGCGGHQATHRSAGIPHAAAAWMW